MFYDYHVHTHFSEDGEMSLGEACLAAVEKDIFEIAVTEHIDMDYPDKNFKFDFNYESYSLAIDRAKKEYDGRLSIVKGLEIGLQPHILHECNAFIEHNKFEFVIASIHAVSGRDLHSGIFCAQRDKKTAYEEYLSELLTCIKGFKRYNVIGHIDIIRRYGHYKENAMKYSDFSDLFDLIFSELVNTGKGLEINTSGFRYNLKSTMPELDILKRYREMGGEILTIGSDAHTSYQLAEHFEIAHALAREAGFAYLTRFPSGKPNFVKI